MPLADQVNDFQSKVTAILPSHLLLDVWHAGITLTAQLADPYLFLLMGATQEIAAL